MNTSIYSVEARQLSCPFSESCRAKKKKKKKKKKKPFVAIVDGPQIVCHILYNSIGLCDGRRATQWSPGLEIR